MLSRSDARELNQGIYRIIAIVKRRSPRAASRLNCMKREHFQFRLVVVRPAISLKHRDHLQDQSASYPKNI